MIRSRSAYEAKRGPKTGTRRAVNCKAQLIIVYGDLLVSSFNWLVANLPVFRGGELTGHFVATRQIDTTRNQFE